MDDIVFDMAAARRKFNASFDNTRSARRKREVGLAQTIDRRTLRTTGRTEQCNFRIRPDLKVEINEAARKSGLGISEWIERAAEALLKAGEPDANA